ncbi:hypothetical protein [Peribacillus acanthi]|uniref:hypothetical protein n=1 Tax=Peribacillus acanthi TaxID=2171554 RepID=UPI000D3E6F5C|nr:hypothetical protein [Peribacillus acanthi]
MSFFCGCKCLSNCCHSFCPPSPTPPSSQEQFIRAYGSLYGDFTARIATANVPIEFDSEGPEFNTAANPFTDTIVILVSGVYEISASLDTTLNTTELAIYGIRRNNVVISGSEFTLAPFTSITSHIGATIQVFLDAGDIITFVPTSVVGTVTYGRAKLTVNRIGIEDNNEN